MRISAIRVQAEGDLTRLRAEMTPAGSAARFDVWFEFPRELGRIPPLGDPFVAGLLFTCMFEGEDLRVDAPVSAKLLDDMHMIQSVPVKWWPGQFERIAVIPIERHVPSPQPDARGRGCFFSGGVDSWYSLLQHMDEVTHIITVRGFDIGNANDRLWGLTESAARRVAARFGKVFVPVRTNLKELSDKSVTTWGKRWRGNFWAEVTHGSGLAAVALCLRDVLESVIVPSSISPCQVRAWGSHPLLDPLWSTDDLRIVHDDCLTTRLRKVARIAEEPLVLETLRVCSYNNLDSYNCGMCEKCYRTMLELRVCGKLEQAKCFDARPDLGVLKRSKLPAPPDDNFYEQLLERAEQIGDGDLVEALRIALEGKPSLYRRYWRWRERTDHVIHTIVHKRIRRLFSRPSKELRYWRK